MDGAPFRPRRQLGELEGAGNGGVDQDVLAICGTAGLPFPEPIPLEEPETYSATASRSQSMFRSLTSVCWNDANGNTTVPSSATLTITYRTTSAVAASTTIGMSQAGSFFIATWGSGVAAL